MSRSVSIRVFAILGLAVLFAFDALAAVGTVQFTNGEVRIRDVAGTVRAAKKGDAINEGDTILTGSVASAQLKMSDDGILAIRPDSELKLDIYRFIGKQDGTENAVMSLLRGGFRTITGLIGRTNKDNYRVRAGTATIGIRGTDHEPFLILSALPGAPQPIAPPGAYDKVNVGEAYISGPLGTVNVAANQVGFAGPSAAPTIVPVMPTFYKATPPIQASAPATGTTASSSGTASATTTGSTTESTSTTTTTQVRETAVVDSTATVTSPTTTTTTDTTTTTTTTTTATTSPTTTTVTQTVSGETTSGTTVDLTAQTATTTSGTSVPITQATYAIEAQTAADEAQVDADLALSASNASVTAETTTNSALTTLFALSTVSTAPATTAISSATSAYNSAQSAVSALGTAVDTSAASTAVTTATTDVNSAQTAVTNVNALPAPNVALATANATSSVSLAGTAATQTQLAQANIDSGFADAIYAVPANATVQSANTSAQSANSLVQTAAATATTQNSAFTTAQASANTALGSATTSLSAANTALTAAQADNAAFSAALASAQAALASAATALAQANTSLSAANSSNNDFLAAQSGASGISSTAAAAVSAAQTASAAAQTAATDAQTAATLAAQRQAAGDLTGAQAALQTALTQLGIAQTQLSAATTAQAQAQATTTAANTQLAAAQSAVSAATTAVSGAIAAANSAQSSATSAQSSATTASSKLTSAQTNVDTATVQAGSAQSSAATAQSQASTATTTQAAAVSAVNTTTSELANEQSAANTVAANYLQAQYSNPAVTSSNFQNFVLSQKPVTGGSELGTTEAIQPQANSTYVLNENKDLIEIRSNAYSRIGLNYDAQTQILNANVKFSGGAAKDHFNAADGTIYMGRWQGGQIDVTDLATSGAVAPFSDPLGLTSAHWLVGLTPADSPLSTPLAPINNVQTLLGTASYSLLAATHPTDALGNVGTLNSASLAANFTRQTVDTSVNLSFSTADAVNVSARNLSISGSASNMPITGSGYDGSFATAACSGTGCEANTYFGFFSGGFGASASGGTTTGAVGNGAALAYRFFTVPSSLGPNQPFSELIDGAAVFATASTPTPGLNPTPVCSACAFRSQVFYPVDGTSTGLTFFARSSVPGTGMSTSSTTPNANYVFDGSGNLVRVLTSSWNAFERSTGSQCTGGAPCLTSPGPAATTNTMVTMAGGAVGTGGATFSSSTVVSSTTATERYSDSTGIRMGRYEGGTVIVKDLATDERLDTSLTGPSGLRSVQWAVREQPTSIPISGSFDFTPAFATKPTDSFGSTNGTLVNAQLTANFTDMTVQPAVRVSINNQTLGATASGVPIFPGSFGFDVSSASVTDTSVNPSAPAALQVGCTGTNCASVPAGGGRNYGGRITGGFGGDGTADGAFFRYTFNTRFDPANPTDVATAASLSRPINDYINGLVAFGKGAQVAARAPDGSAEIATAYFAMPVGGTFGVSDQSHATDYQTSPTSFTITGGNLVSVSENPATTVVVRSESLSGGSAVSGGQTVTGQAGALAATGIAFGRYDAMKSDGSGTLATLTGSDEVNGVATSFSRNILGSYHWFKGPEPFPFGFAGALTGTASYSLAGYTDPTDQNSLTGSVSTVSTDTNLSVNFNAQAVSLNMKVTMPPSTGPVAGTLDRVWVASAPNIRLNDFSGGFSAFSGASAGTHESLTVTLNGGTNAFGEIRGALTGTGLNGAGAAYAFGGSDPSNSGSHEHVNGALAFSLSSYNPGSSALAPSGSSINLDDVFYRMGLISAGLLPAGAYESESQHFLRPTISSVLRTNFNTSGFPLAFDLQWPFVFPSGCTSGCFAQDVPARLSIVPSDVATVATALSTTATAASLVDTGIDQGTLIRWGRYAGGKVAVFDRISGASLALIDTTSQPMHFLWTAAQNGPVSLPISGTANYVLVGNTSPTDNFGNVGTLGSATFNADFGAQTVSSGVALTVNSQNWSASVTDAPIIKGSFFYAQKLLGGGSTATPLNVTSSLGTNTAGTLVGGFTGTSGQGAGLAYSLNVNGNTGTTVSGVAAFRKP